MTCAATFARSRTGPGPPACFGAGLGSSPRRGGLVRGPARRRVRPP